MGTEPVVLTDEQWMLRLVTAVARGQRLGYDDWTADNHIVDEFTEKYGQWGECDACPSGSAHHFVKVTEVGHPNPDTLKLCAEHRQPWFPTRKADNELTLSCERCGRGTDELVVRRMPAYDSEPTRRVCGICVADTLPIEAAA